VESQGDSQTPFPQVVAGKPTNPFAVWEGDRLGERLTDAVLEGDLDNDGVLDCDVERETVPDDVNDGVFDNDGVNDFEIDGMTDDVTLELNVVLVDPLGEVDEVKDFDTLGDNDGEVDAVCETGDAVDDNDAVGVVEGETD
jgi:hypothetical protein